METIEIVQQQIVRYACGCTTTRIEVQRALPGSAPLCASHGLPVISEERTRRSADRPAHPSTLGCQVNMTPLFPPEFNIDHSTVMPGVLRDPSPTPTMKTAGSRIRQPSLMWTLTVRSVDAKPTEYLIKPGTNTIGRRQDNDIVIDDEAASRKHAQIHLDESTDSLTVRDLGSRNGTFINRRRLTENFAFKLAPNDILRIGTYEIMVNQPADLGADEAAPSGLQPFSRDLLLEAFDNHAILLYEAIQQLNNILDIDAALKEVSQLLQLTLDADKCQVVLAADFDRLPDLGFPRSLAASAIQQRSALLLPNQDAQSVKLIGGSARRPRVRSAMCVPVVSSEKTIALIYTYKTRSGARSFTQRDLQLAVAVSHLAALTIERISLMERVREENRVRQLLQRFLAPAEAEFLLRNYLKTGRLPELTEQRCTILFADIAGSIGMAERLGAKKFGELLERYYQDVTGIVFQYGGLLANYLGDGVMAVFGMTGARSEPEAKAVAAGLDLLQLLRARYHTGEKRIDVGIGINTGAVVAGYVSTRERVELTIVGDTVNVASGLQTLARPNRLLIGPETYARIRKSYEVRSLGPTAIKDRSRPIKVYEVLPK